jgi:hypothetical protein
VLTLNSVLTAATYPVLGEKPAATLGPVDPGVGNAGSLNLQVYNASVYVRLYLPDDDQYALRGQHPTDEILMVATATQSQIRSWQGVAGFTARDAVAGVHGRLIADLSEPKDALSVVGVPIGSGGNQIGGGMIAGHINSDGTTKSGTGFTSVQLGTGLYEIDFPAGTFSTEPAMTFSPETTNLLFNTDTPRSVTAKGVKFTARATGAATDTAFEFIAAPVGV